MNFNLRRDWKFCVFMYVLAVIYYAMFGLEGKAAVIAVVLGWAIISFRQRFLIPRPEDGAAKPAEAKKEAAEAEPVSR